MGKRKFCDSLFLASLIFPFQEKEGNHMTKLEWTEFDEEDGFEGGEPGKAQKKKWNAGIFPSIILMIFVFFSAVITAAIADLLKIF